MKRLERRNITYKDIGYKSSGGLGDLIDNAVKVAFRINDEEYDYFCEKMSDEEIDFILNEKFTFSELRKLSGLIDKYLNDLYKEYK
jgi:hypothetical protein